MLRFENSADQQNDKACVSFPERTIETRTSEWIEACVSARLCLQHSNEEPLGGT